MCVCVCIWGFGQSIVVYCMLLLLITSILELLENNDSNTHYNDCLNPSPSHTLASYLTGPSQHTGQPGTSTTARSQDFLITVEDDPPPPAPPAPEPESKKAKKAGGREKVRTVSQTMLVSFFSYLKPKWNGSILLHPIITFHLQFSRLITDVSCFKAPGCALH